MQQMAKTPGGEKFDHFWLSPDKSDLQRMTCNKKSTYKRVSSIGVIRKYRRDNGTWDYTVKSVEKYSIEELIDKLNTSNEKGHGPEKRLRLVNAAIDVIEAHRKEQELVFGIAWSVSDIYERMIEEQKELQACVDAQIEKEKTVLKNGKCKNLDQAKFSSKARKPVKGF